MQTEHGQSHMNQFRGASTNTSQSIEWYSEGDERIIEIGNVRVAVRFIGRNGRRCRIAIEAPAGSVFYSEE